MSLGSDTNTSNSASMGVAGGVALILFGFLLFFIRGVLNPILLFLALVVGMLPLRRNAFFWPVIASAGGLTLFWLLRELGFLLAPFVLALIAAYVLSPIVGWAADRRPLSRLADDTQRSRTLAIFVLSLPLVGAVAGLFIWGLPALVRESNELLRQAPDLLARVATLLAALEGALGRLRLPGVDGSEWVARIRGLEGADVVQFLQERSAMLARRSWEGVLGLGRGLGTLGSIVGYLVLTPVVAFYLMRDFPRLGRKVDELIPSDREGIRSFLSEYDALLSSYLRGQITVAISVGAITGIGLWITQFPYAFLLGVLVAVFSVVPYLGLLLSLFPALAIALASGAVWPSLVKIGIVYGVAQVLEGTVISPRILGSSTGLHPVWILLAIALGGFFFGFVGLLIAVPGAVGVKLLVVRGAEQYRASEFFSG